MKGAFEPAPRDRTVLVIIFEYGAQYFIPEDLMHTYLAS